MINDVNINKQYKNDRCIRKEEIISSKSLLVPIRNQAQAPHRITAKHVDTPLFIGSRPGHIFYFHYKTSH